MASTAIPVAAAATPRSASRAFTALRYPGIRLILLGSLFAFSGYWIWTVSQGWLVLQLTDSPGLVGLVTGFAMFPFLFMSLVGGVLADRVNRKRVSMLSRSFVVAMMLGEAALYWTGMIEVWMMLIIALAAGVGFALDNPVRQSMVPDLVPPEHLANAIALTFATSNVCNILGPSIGGILLATTGPGWAFFATAIGNSALFCCYILLRLPPRTRKTGAPSAIRQFREGLRFMRSDEILYILVIAAAISAFIQPYQSMMPVFARELGVGTVELGLMSAAPGIGALVGSLTVATLGGVQRKGRLLLGGALMVATMLLVFTTSPSLYVALPILVVLGLSNAFFMTMNNTIVLMRVPDELRGRVISLMIVAWGLAPLGATLVGVVAGMTNVRLAEATFAAAALVIIVTVFVRRPALRAV